MDHPRVCSDFPTAWADCEFHSGIQTPFRVCWRSTLWGCETCEGDAKPKQRSAGELREWSPDYSFWLARIWGDVVATEERLAGIDRNTAQLSFGVPGVSSFIPHNFEVLPGRR